MIGAAMALISRSSLVIIALSTIVLAACDGGGTFPLEIEVKDGASTPGKKPDELELVVKTVPDTEVRFEGRVVQTGDKPTASFTVPKNELKLGKNTFNVEATTGVFVSKKTAKASATWEASVRSLVRVHPSGDGDTPVTCAGAMCAAPAFKIDKTGKLGGQLESAIAGRATVGAGAKLDLAAGKRTPFSVDVGAMLGTISLSEKSTIEVPIALEAGSERSLDKVTFQGPAIEGALATSLARVATGPLTFPGEGGAPPAPRAIAVVLTSATGPGKVLVSGPAKKAEDLDLITVAKPVERFFACGGAATSASGILYLDLDLVTYERRSGKPVGTRKLMADRVPCPPTPTAGQVKAEVRELDVVRAATEALNAKK